MQAQTTDFGKSPLVDEAARSIEAAFAIERNYQELKQKLGLGDYEGRGWRGLHHYATLCIAAYGFLIAKTRRPSLQNRPALQAKAIDHFSHQRADCDRISFVAAPRVDGRSCSTA